MDHFTPLVLPRLCIGLSTQLLIGLFASTSRGVPVLLLLCLAMVVCYPVVLKVPTAIDDPWKALLASPN
jgi:hypothetical protein